MTQDSSSKELKAPRTYPQRYILTAAQASWYLKKEKFEKPNGEIETRLVPAKWGGRGDPAILNRHFYDSLKTLAEERDAQFRILPIQGCTLREGVLHKTVEDLPELFDWSRKFMKLNENITQSDIRVPPQNVDPATSRSSLTAKYKASLVYPHAKQRLAPVPSVNSPIPRYLATTGCITTPNYNRDNDRGDQAFRDHTYGAIFVDVLDKNYYTMRFLTAKKNGKFVDRGIEYDGTKDPRPVKTEALVLGDLHIGSENRDAMEASYQMIEELKPKRVIVHDLFSGKSIAHWELRKPLTRIQMYESGKLSLEAELESVHDELKRLSDSVGSTGKVYIVHSNHDDFLAKYLNTGQQWQEHDLWNAKFCYGLVGRILHKGTPSDFYLKEALSHFGNIPSNINFLGMSTPLSVLGYTLSVHGHVGKEGRYGMNIQTMDQIIGKGIIAHKHCPEIYKDCKVVGTNSELNEKYRAGSPSAAMAANGAIYSTGMSQLLPIIEGVW